MAAMRRLRIAQVAPPVERVPPAAYGGTERVVHELTTQLVERGNDVALFASGDSQTSARLVPTVDRALRPAGIESDAGGWFATTVKMVVEQAAEFDVIHSHLEWWSIPLARLSPIPVVATFHGRLDLPWADRLLRDAPEGMVAISRHQASTHPDVPWTIIHNGLTLERAPFIDQPGDAFCFVGRVDAEKGIIEAIDIALRAGRRLRIAAKVGNLARQRDYYEQVFRPALQRAGRSIEYLGELQPAERDQLFAESYATLMPGAWPEPFGLVSIESLACGTPVLARRVGALPEIIREGVDGFFGDDAVAMAFFADRLGGLDRREIRERVIERFSAARMTDRYEELYARMVQPTETAAVLRDRTPDAEEVAEALAEQLPSEVTEPSDARLPGVPDVTDVTELTDASGEAPEVEAPSAPAEMDAAEIVAIEEAAPEAVAEAPEPEVPVAELEPEGQAAPEAVAEVREPEVPEPEVPVAEVEPEVLAEPEAVAEPSEPEPAVVAVELDAAAEPEAELEPEGELEPEAVVAAAETISETPAPEALDEPIAVAVAVDVRASDGESTRGGGDMGLTPDAAPVAAAEPVADDDLVAQVETPVQEPVEEQKEAARAPVAVAELEALEEAPDIEPEVAAATPSADLVAEVEMPAEEPVAGAAPTRETPSRAEPSPAAKPRAASASRPPIAVGPGPSAPREPQPTAPTPPAAPTPATPTPAAPTPAAPTPAAQKPPPQKPPAKRPSRTISIFTRQWSGSSGKAAGTRRRDRS